ncbi:MAG: trypsin-like peptidase domain-containing protein, partial [Elusimicrobia bacterium]|nr:trypsin-like peptidase domain-containing protein [Elusimicrobiota bacterium]
PRAGAALGRWTGRALRAYQARRAVAHDDFGGPKTEPMSVGRRLAYGAKWGLNLVGIQAILNLTLAPLLSHFQWPLLLSGTALRGLGRVELLTQFGPTRISQALATHPLAFLGTQVPMSVGLEEFSFRFLTFGLLFGALAATKPLTKLAARLLEQIPDASGLRSTAQRVLRGAGGLISYYAFPAAALYSSFQFAVAHFAAWGVDPLVFALNLAAGYALARVAYKTRGLAAPFVAHLVFNLAMLGAGAIAIALHAPLAASVYAVLAAIVGVVSLWYNWRSARKERAFLRLQSLKNGVVGLLMAALIGGSVLGGLPASRESSAALLSARLPAAVQLASPLAQSPAAKPAAAAPQAAPAATTAPADATAAPAAAPAVESPADMVARVKPTVVQVMVTLPGGYAIGSGVIVTPDGRIVTNAHVVDAHGVGEIVDVQLINGQHVPAKILAVNHDRDLAFLQLPPLAGGQAWPYSNFATTVPREGDTVYAMGHPLGLPFTVTKGIISGLGSRGNMYVQYLQTDASITHGNSGGPLFNARGEILGINTMGPENAGSIGFSIVTPSIVRALVQFDKTGNIDTAALGVIADMTSPDQPDNGVAVEAVRPGSAAAKAGLRPGDVIVGAGGVQLRAPGGLQSAHELSALLAQAIPGEVIPISVVRGDQMKVIKVKLDAKATSEATSGAHSLGGPTAP